MAGAVFTIVLFLDALRSASLSAISSSLLRRRGVAEVGLVALVSLEIKSAGSSLLLSLSLPLPDSSSSSPSLLAKMLFGSLDSFLIVAARLPGRRLNCASADRPFFVFSMCLLRE